MFKYAITWRDFNEGTINSNYLYSTMLKLIFFSAQSLSAVTENCGTEMYNLLKT